jgi:hypothetical protein
VTVTKLRFRYLSIDAGLNHRGWSFESEYYFRSLSDFLATGPLPVASVYDNGVMVELMRMVIPKTLGGRRPARSSATTRWARPERRSRSAPTFSFDGQRNASASVA